MSSPSSKRTLKPAPMTTAADVSPFGMSNQGLGQPLTVADPGTRLAVPTGGPVAPPNPRPQYGDPTGGAVGSSALGDSVGQPATKKGRTNTPWTAAEEQRLKQMRDQGKSWSEIAKTFPNRTEGSVKKHWYKDMHYAEFDGDESQALLAAIKEYEANKWKSIGQKLGKPAKACEQYAKQHFGGAK